MRFAMVPALPPSAPVSAPQGSSTYPVTRRRTGRKNTFRVPWRCEPAIISAQLPPYAKVPSVIRDDRSTVIRYGLPPLHYDPSSSLDMPPVYVQYTADNVSHAHSCITSTQPNAQLTSDPLDTIDLYIPSPQQTLSLPVNRPRPTIQFAPTLVEFTLAPRQ